MQFRRKASSSAPTPHTPTPTPTHTYLEVRSEGVQYGEEDETNFIGEGPLHFGVEFNFITGDLVDGEGERGGGGDEGGSGAGGHWVAL